MNILSVSWHFLIGIDRDKSLGLIGGTNGALIDRQIILGAKIRGRSRDDKRPRGAAVGQSCRDHRAMWMSSRISRVNISWFRSAPYLRASDTWRLAARGQACGSDAERDRYISVYL